MKRLIAMMAVAVFLVGASYAIAGAADHRDFSACLSDKGELTQVAQGAVPAGDCKKDEWIVQWGNLREFAAFVDMTNETLSMVGVAIEGNEQDIEDLSISYDELEARLAEVEALAHEQPPPNDIEPRLVLLEDAVYPSSDSVTSKPGDTFLVRDPIGRLEADYLARWSLPDGTVRATTGLYLVSADGTTATADIPSVLDPGTYNVGFHENLAHHPVFVIEFEVVEKILHSCQAAISRIEPAPDSPAATRAYRLEMSHQVGDDPGELLDTITVLASHEVLTRFALGDYELLIVDQSPGLTPWTNYGTEPAIYHSPYGTTSHNIEMMFEVGDDFDPSNFWVEYQVGSDIHQLHEPPSNVDIGVLHNYSPSCDLTVTPDPVPVCLFNAVQDSYVVHDERPVHVRGGVHFRHVPNGPFEIWWSQTGGLEYGEVTELLELDVTAAPQDFSGAVFYRDHLTGELSGIDPSSSEVYLVFFEADFETSTIGAVGLHQVDAAWIVYQGTTLGCQLDDFLAS